MLVQCLLINCPMEIGYEHVFDFENRKNQMYFFEHKLNANRLTTEVNTKVDGFLEKVNIKFPYANARHYDYIIIFEPGTQVPYFFFITRMKMLTKDVTELSLKLDVFQTYQFDFKFNMSFVDRCHVRRWEKYDDNIPTDNNLDEGLEYGATTIKTIENVKKMRSNYILATTTPIGKLGASTGGGGTGAGGCGDPSKGIPTNKYYRYLKGIEGLNQYPVDIGDGVTTFGYGVTKENEPTYFAKLGAPPVSEKKASEVLFELIPARYGNLVASQFKKDGINMSTVDKHKFDAFVDLCYNTGYYNSKLYKMWLAGESMDKIKSEWLVYAIMPGSIFEEGLRRRRKEEWLMFSEGTYSNSPITIHGNRGQAIGTVEGDGYMVECESVNDKYFTVNNEGGQNWIMPAEGKVTATFPTYSSGKPHSGIDVACPEGTPVRASKDGVCVKRREITTSYGKYLFIEHAENLISIYAHNSKLLINEGDHVKAGDIIAYSGNTGNSTGAHSHFEIRINNIAINPAPNLKVGDIIKHKGV